MEQPDIVKRVINGRARHSQKSHTDYFGYAGLLHSTGCQNHGGIVRVMQPSRTWKEFLNIFGLPSTHKIWIPRHNIIASSRHDQVSSVPEYVIIWIIVVLLYHCCTFTETGLLRHSLCITDNNMCNENRCAHYMLTSKGDVLVGVVFLNLSRKNRIWD